MAEETERLEIVLPEGRLINHSLFVKDVYKDQKTGKEGIPNYKVEVAYDAGVLNNIEDDMRDFADAKWGAGAGDADDLILPMLKGDNLAKKREDGGKPGDAYKGKDVLRAKTIYNKDGQDGPGGVSVYAEDLSEIGGTNQNDIYQGCMVIVGVVLSGYTVSGQGGDPDRNAISLYLQAVQKSGDGERLVASKDNSKLFKPVGRAKAGGTKRRQRKG